VSTLTLVRHGQATPFQREGAILTSRGEAQALRMAQFWIAKGVRFDEVHTGELARQVQTEQVVAASFREAGLPWPAAIRDSSWNEYDAAGVLSHIVPADAGLAALAAEFEQARGSPDEKRKFQRMFQAAMSCWLEGAIPAEGVEPWPAFRDRVSGAIRRIAAGPPGRRIAVFTSGGPIGFTVHYAMRSPAGSFLDVNWRVRNTSVTEFIFDRDRFTLDTFNCIPHLENPDLHTWR
jgi:broad specificity phosphatase PhoE